MAIISPFICAFCGHRTSLPTRREGEAYEGIGTYEVIRSSCGAVAFCQADAFVSDWPRDQVTQTLCREVLKQEPDQCIIRRNYTDGLPANEVIWAKAAS